MKILTLVIGLCFAQVHAMPVLTPPANKSPVQVIEVPDHLYQQAVNNLLKKAARKIKKHTPKKKGSDHQLSSIVVALGIDVRVGGTWWSLGANESTQFHLKVGRHD